jgi:hypothetical protein
VSSATLDLLSGSPLSAWECALVPLQALQGIVQLRLPRVARASLPAFEMRKKLLAARPPPPRGAPALSRLSDYARSALDLDALQLAKQRASEAESVCVAMQADAEAARAAAERSGVFARRAWAAERAAAQAAGAACAQAAAARAAEVRERHAARWWDGRLLDWAGEARSAVERVWRRELTPFGDWLVRLKVTAVGASAGMIGYAFFFLL